MFVSNANTQNLKQLLVPKQVFLESLRRALETQQGYAASKLGNTEKHLLLYRMMRDRQTLPKQRLALEMWLKQNAVSYAGLFPADVEFYARYGKIFADSVCALDVIGISSTEDTGIELDLVKHFGLTNPLTRNSNLHPDRSIPDDSANCYLPYFRGKRILIVNPFGKLLAARATRETFEGVWRASGKPFFEPAQVEGLEFPYGFAHETWTRYPSTLELQRKVEAEIERRDFDVALIGAGGMGIPLAAHVKRMGKVALVLGGHLQLIFGVKGKRWHDRPEWRDVYFNEWWIEMPQEYRPKAGDDTGDYSYW